MAYGRFLASFLWLLYIRSVFRGDEGLDEPVDLRLDVLDLAEQLVSADCHSRLLGLAECLVGFDQFGDDLADVHCSQVELHLYSFIVMISLLNCILLLLHCSQTFLRSSPGIT